VLGLVFVGTLLAISYHRFGGLLDGWKRDTDRFMADEISWGQLMASDEARFMKGRSIGIAYAHSRAPFLGQAPVCGLCSHHKGSNSFAPFSNAVAHNQKYSTQKFLQTARVLFAIRNIARKDGPRSSRIAVRGQSLDESLSEFVRASERLEQLERLEQS
jgi:hypothetical protein